MYWQLGASYVPAYEAGGLPTLAKRLEPVARFHPKQDGRESLRRTPARVSSDARLVLGHCGILGFALSPLP